MLPDILGHDHGQWRPPLVRHFTKSWHFTELDLITDFGLINKSQDVSIEHLQRVWLANRERLLFRTPGPVQFGNCICSNVDTILSWTCLVSGLRISNVPRYFHFALYVRTPNRLSGIAKYCHHTGTTVVFGDITKTIVCDILKYQKWNLKRSPYIQYQLHWGKRLYLWNRFGSNAAFLNLPPPHFDNMT